MARSKAVGSIAPAAAVMITILFRLAAVAAAMVDERGRGDNGHLDLWRVQRMRIMIDSNS